MFHMSNEYNGCKKSAYPNYMEICISQLFSDYNNLLTSDKRDSCMNIKVYLTLKIISRHALPVCHPERHFVCVLRLNGGKLTFHLISFVKRTQNYVQDDVMRDAK